jgi:hypothetical protein
MRRRWPAIAVAASLVRAGCGGAARPPTGREKLAALERAAGEVIRYCGARRAHSAATSALRSGFETALRTMYVLMAPEPRERYRVGGVSLTAREELVGIAYLIDSPYCERDHAHATALLREARKLPSISR